MPTDCGKGRITDMTERDILNKIKESADSVEIPEGLKPEQIELKLKEAKQ